MERTLHKRRELHMLKANFTFFVAAFSILADLFAVTSAKAADYPVVARFPKNNVWNTSIAKLPLHPNSKKYIENIGNTKSLHPDFGAGTWEGQPLGIPINIVGPSTKRAQVKFEYADESDRVAYPIPENPHIEGGIESDGDRHLIAFDPANAKLYELFHVSKTIKGGWSAGSGAVFDLRSNVLRPEGWTSADAAGLPIMPGLVRHSEVASGSIEHALRFTAPRTQRAFVWPATHFASSNSDTNLPPMGIRLRLRANFDESRFPPDCQIILRCLKNYGMFLADNGSSWFISGEPNERWNNESLHQLSLVTGADFEVVDESGLMLSRHSAECRVP
jgi:hypothetical protein